MWGDSLETVQIASADPSYNTPRTPETVTSNAVQSMQPVTAGAEAPSAWDDFWRVTVTALVGAGVDRLDRGSAPAQPVQPAAPTVITQQSPDVVSRYAPLLLLGVLGLIAYRALK